MYHATATAVAALRKKTASKLHYTSWSLRNRYVPIFKVQNNHFPLHVILFFMVQIDKSAHDEEIDV